MGFDNKTFASFLTKATTTLENLFPVELKIGNDVYAATGNGERQGLAMNMERGGTETLGELSARVRRKLIPQRLEIGSAISFRAKAQEGEPEHEWIACVVDTVDSSPWDICWTLRLIRA